VNWKRVYDIDDKCKKLIDEVRGYDMNNYVYIPWIKF
jgi:hypothetical protein